MPDLIDPQISYWDLMGDKCLFTPEMLDVCLELMRQPMSAEALHSRLRKDSPLPVLEKMWQAMIVCPIESPVTMTTRWFIHTKGLSIMLGRAKLFWTGEPSGECDAGGLVQYIPADHDPRHPDFPGNRSDG